MIKAIDGFDGYFVTDGGKVYSTKVYKMGKELSATKNSGGYFNVHLSQMGVVRVVAVHRLVAEAFIPNPDNLPQVNHIDGNKLNNNVENLEWCDASYNIQHAWRIGLQRTTPKLQAARIQNGKRNASLATNALKKKVEMLDLQGNVLNTFESLCETGRQLFSKECANRILGCIRRHARNPKLGILEIDGKKVCFRYKG